MKDKFYYRVQQPALTGFVFFCAMALFLFSCGEQQRSNIREGAEEILIDMNNAVFLSLDSMIERVEFIKLETTAESIFSNISQVLFIDSFIIISDKASVRVFDASGKFKRSLSRKGQGPGEYNEVNYMTVNPADNSLCILDRYQDREIHYNIADGAYLHTKRKLYYADCLEYLESGNKAYTGVGIPDHRMGKYSKFPLYVTDENSDIIYGDFVEYYKEGIFMYGMPKNLWRFDNKVYFSPNFSGMIYQVTDSAAIPKYHINIASNGMPPIDNSTTSEMMDEYFKQYFIFNGFFIELKDLSYINIRVPNGNPFVIYSHSRKQTYFCNLNGTHPMFPFIRDISPSARYQDNAVVFELSPWHLIMNKEALYSTFKSYKSFFDDLFAGIDEESNSILLICHLNKDM